ncbi:MAG TPA: hypothetical protein VK611_07500 [Acidimicrobiales bacterium]|nr:hypothetical protein [Acidimicrobiales bacterium]
MTTKTKNQPARATIEKVAGRLGVVPRTASTIANETGLTPATARRCLVVLVDQGRAEKTDRGEWVAAQQDAGHPEPQAEAPPTPIKEPAALTKSAIGKLSRDELVAWATSCSLLEHLTEDDLAALGTKGKVVDEVTGALLRAEVDEDRRAAATDEVARPLAELIGFTPPVKPAKAAKAIKATKQAAARPEAPASPLTGVAVKLAALGLSDKLARHDAQLVELLAEHGPLTRDQVLAKVPGLSAWAFRRMSEGKHSDRSFSPLLSVTGQGKTRTYQLSQQGTKVVGR